MIRLTILTLAIAPFAATPAFAAQEDTQFWLAATASKSLGDDWTLVLDATDKIADRGDVVELSAIVDKKLSDTVTIGGGYLNGVKAGADERRLIQHVTFKHDHLSFRVRLEERFYEGADQMALRLRNRIKYNPSIAEDTRFVGSVELLYHLQQKTYGVDDAIDNWRIFAGINRKLGHGLAVEAGYQLNITPIPGAENRISHVPRLTLSWKG